MSLYAPSIKFHCACCGPKTGYALFDIAREFERMQYQDQPNTPVVEIEVSSAESVAIFCSKICRDRGGPAILAGQRIRVPKTRPALGPIEICARCGYPVDMSDWHLVFLESDTNATGTPGKPDEVEYIGVLCRNCAPLSTYRSKA